MIVNSKYTKSFKSDNITAQKYRELYDYAMYLRDYKNKLSEYVSQNLMFFLEMRKLEFLKYIRNNFELKVHSNFDSHAIIDVYAAYENKFDAINGNLTFEKRTFQGLEFYKRDTKKHCKGDLKKVSFNKSKTPLSVCLTYLARYGNEGTVDYIHSQLGKDEKKTDFYNNILRCIEKFGFDRLLSLATTKRDRIVRYYSRKPIEFKSLTFRGRSRKKLIVDYNSNYNSQINAFISLSWETRKSMDIPVKYALNYHGRMQEYRKSNPDYEYCLTFDERHKQVKVNICKDGSRYIPSVSDTDKAMGIDVNVKHNLFTLSDGTTYDYDRQLLRDYAKCCKELDKLKEDKSYVIGKRRQWKFDTLKHKMQKRQEQLIADMCKELHSKGIRHLVMENLNNGFGRSFVKDNTNEDLNFNRVVKFLGISSLKQMVEHIARNYDIAVSTVHSSYTSKMCPICGCIEDENRPSQEEFSCIGCGHEENADVNAAVNIRNRVCVAVLRDKLLKQLDNGAFEPRKLKREKVKEVLLSFRGSLQNGGSERVESSMTTF